MAKNDTKLKRTKKPKKSASVPRTYNTGQLTTMAAELVSRVNLMTRMGYQYDGERDIYEVLGYKKQPEYRDYYTHYRRQDIAKAVINRPVEGTWRGDVTVVESDDDNDTPLENAWLELYERLGLKTVFSRLDKLAGLGYYGVLLLGLDDVSRDTDFAMPVKGGKRQLLYLKPLSEESAQINEWENDAGNSRYGLPRYYDISIINPGDESSQASSKQLKVHHTRVVHVPGELMENEVQGIPRLEAVYNRLKDLEKLTGGSAEMFWRGARPGYQGKVDPEYTMTTPSKEALQEEISEFENNLRRILINEGVTLEALAPQVSDPSSHVDVQIQMISTVTGIPKRLLTGSERGELASSEDRDNWFDLLQARREEFAEPQIVRAFISRCIEYGILPKPADRYSVQWSDLWSMSDQEKAEIGKTRAEALKAYNGSPANMDTVPPQAFFKYFLGLDDDQIELIEEMRDAAIRDEDEDFSNEEQEE